MGDGGLRENVRHRVICKLSDGIRITTLARGRALIVGGSRRPLHRMNLVEPPPHARVARWADIPRVLLDARAVGKFVLAMGDCQGGEEHHTPDLSERGARTDLQRQAGGVMFGSIMCMDDGGFRGECP